MKIIKPTWVHHDGKFCNSIRFGFYFWITSACCLLIDQPIFSIDVHPDSSRFATGGQGINDRDDQYMHFNFLLVRENIL